MKLYSLLFAAAFCVVGGCSKINTAFDVELLTPKVETYETVKINATAEKEAASYTVDWGHLGLEVFDELPGQFTHYYPAPGVYHVKIKANCQDQGTSKCEFASFTRTVEVEVVQHVKKYVGNFNAQTTVDLSSCGGTDTVINSTTSVTYLQGEQARISNLFGMGDVHGLVVVYPPLENSAETTTLTLSNITIGAVTLTPANATVTPPGSVLQVNDIEISGQYSVQGSGCLVNFTSNLQRR